MNGAFFHVESRLPQYPQCTSLRAMSYRVMPISKEDLRVVGNTGFCGMRRIQSQIILAGVLPDRGEPSSRVSKSKSDMDMEPVRGARCDCEPAMRRISTSNR